MSLDFEDSKRKTYRKIKIRIFSVENLFMRIFFIFFLESFDSYADPSLKEIS